jgi:hypothetical protein
MLQRIFMLSLKSITTLTAILFVFLFAWVLLANYLPTWSDEDGNLGQSKAFYLTGKFKSFDFDQYKIGDNRIEARDLWFDGIVSFLYSFKPEGVSEYMWARLAPLLFTLLTYFLVMLYGRLRFRLSADSLIYLSAFFLGQSMVMEEALFIRIYAPLMFCMAGVFICYWEGRQFFLEGKKAIGMGLFLASAALMGITIIDHWQFEQIPVIVLAILLSFRKNFEGLVQFLNIKKVQFFFLCLGMLLLCPFLIIAIDEILSKMVIGNMLIGITFITFWDNAMGLLRSALALNVCLMGVWVAIVKGKEKINFGFGWWLYFIGIISAVLGGLLNPHNYVFFTRYFLTPVALSVIGFAFNFEKLVGSSVLRKNIIIFYLFMNFLLSLTTFYWDRPNIQDAVRWLKSNIGQDETLLIFNADLGLYAGEPLMSHAYPLQQVSDEMGKARALGAFLKQHHQGKVYYLMVDGYFFRDKLYRWTTGEERTVPDSLYNYIHQRVPHQSVLLNLRGGLSIDIFDQKVLENGLNELIKRGYPARDRNRNISIHKRILKHIFKLLRLPDKREDIRKLEHFFR